MSYSYMHLYRRVTPFLSLTYPHTNYFCDVLHLLKHKLIETKPLTCFTDIINM